MYLFRAITARKQWRHDLLAFLVVIVPSLVARATAVIRWTLRRIGNCWANACNPVGEITLVEDPIGFGFNVRDKHTEYYYQLQLYVNNISEPVQGWATFSKRSPINIENSSDVSELVVYLKINDGVFDFRKLKERQAQITVQLFSNDVLVKRGCSDVFHILPKKRKSSAYKGGSIDIQWHSQIVSNNNCNVNNWNTNTNVREDVFPVISEDSESNLQNDSSADLSDVVMEICDPRREIFSDINNSITLYRNEQFVTLYDGNAEVRGDFRALNFYKSSDINIKEDIRLLIEDYDCREAFLKIDGVEYKFKKGIHPDTNRRFVGYIAQQVQSVVPEAVHLIDGILHVDYESLIPYLSESMRQNFRDIQDVQHTIDALYDKFTQQEQDKLNTTSDHNNTYKPRGMTVWIAIGLIIAMSVAASIGIFSLMSQSHVQLRTPLTHVNVRVDSKPSLAERKVLEELFVSLNGNNWTRNDHWLTNKSICEWYGIKCDNMAIISIRLPNNTLNGTIPSNITRLQSLQYIDFEFNSISGTIPNLADLTNLRLLRLRRNALIGRFLAIHLSNQLTALDLSYNAFYGPMTVHNLRALQYLDLSNNYIEGELPDFSGSSLRYLNLTNNSFFGTVPKFNTALETLSLSNNVFIGGEFAQLPDLQLLKTLEISHTSIGRNLVLNSNLIENINIGYTMVRCVEVPANFQFDSLVACDMNGLQLICPLPKYLATKCRYSV